MKTLHPHNLHGVICALTTEDLRIEIPYIPFLRTCKKSPKSNKKYKRKLEKFKNYHDIETPLYINPYFSSLIELWVEPGARMGNHIWNKLRIGEGDDTVRNL